MVYNSKFIAVIKCNGKILREINDGIVILPFGAEYSILLKNLDARRAIVNLSVDGTDMLGGRRLVIDANSESELKGKMIDGVVRNHFKFIQKTAKIQDHRGDKVDDGLIRIKFGFEREQFLSFNQPPFSYPTYFGHRGGTLYGSSTGNPDAIRSKIVSSSMFDSNPNSRELTSKSFEPQAEEGITVPGSETNQQFQSTTVGSIEDHNVIVIQLKGTDRFDEPVSVPLTVQSKLECPTCGTKSRSGVKYCPECGTNIQV